MKLPLTLLLSLFSFVLLGQTDTMTLGWTDFKAYQNDSQTWVFDFDADTVTVEDTLFLDGDTILTVRDTSVMILPHNLGNGFSGMISVITDSIVDALQGDVAFALYQSVCDQVADNDDCPWVAIASGGASHTSPPDESHLFFQVRGLKLKIVYRAISGTSSIKTYMILKPSSLSNNASN